MNEESLTQSLDNTGHSVGIRIGQQLVKATAPFAAEDVTKSWWHVGVTFSLMIVALIGAGMLPWWPALPCCRSSLRY